MKNKTVVEQTICDICGKGQCYDECFGCHIDICWDCRKTKGIEFKHAVHFVGSGDGFCCNECLGKEAVTKTPLFKAYKEITNLRGEYDLWWKNFDARTKEAERILKNVQGKD